jgi:hypothetical protein
MLRGVILAVILAMTQSAEIKPFPGKGVTYTLNVQVSVGNEFVRVVRSQVEAGSDPEVVRDTLADTLRVQYSIAVRKVGKDKLVFPPGVRVEFFSPDLPIDSLPIVSPKVRPAKP